MRYLIAFWCRIFIRCLTLFCNICIYYEGVYFFDGLYMDGPSHSHHNSGKGVYFPFFFVLVLLWMGCIWCGCLWWHVLGIYHDNRWTLWTVVWGLGMGALALEFNWVLQVCIVCLVLVLLGIGIGIVGCDMCIQVPSWVVFESGDCCCIWHFLPIC